MLANHILATLGQRSGFHSPHSSSSRPHSNMTHAPSAGSSSSRARVALHQCVQRVVASHPLARSSERALDVLSEVAERYICLLARTAAENAAHASREHPTLWDVLGALEHVGAQPDELAKWLEDGQNLGGDPAERDENLAAQLRHGRPLAPGPADELHYVPVPRAAVNDLEQLRVLSEEPWLEPLDGDLEGVNGRASSSERTGSASPRTPEGLPSANGHSKRRRLSHDANLPEYVPRTLPGFPELPPQEGAGSSAPDAAAAVASGEVGWIAVDGEWAQLQAAKRHAAAVERAQARSALENGDALHANGGDSPAPPEPAASPAAGDEADSAPPTLDMWRRGVRYEGSMLASQQETWDLPSLPATRAPAEVTHNSSLRAFANDYRALLSEHTAREMLTPSGSAHAAAAAMRRTLALSTADPGKFLPTDSVFAATYARPTVIPFQPSASHFVTSTGKFAPTRPLGRPVTLIAPSGSLVPTLSYRWPTHTLNAARSIAGPGLQQRVARFSDPEPVYDASGVERVFQGAPAPTELLEPNHSALAPAMRHLSVATQPRQDALDAQPLLSTFNLAEKPKEGMLVHTWEWTTRDYAEPTLPGKRVRGVNEAEGSGRAGAGAMSGPDTPRAERGV